jgi:uncharacterized protein (TIGR00159 family)
MLEGFLHLFAQRPGRDILIDLLDIAVVTYVIYRALLVLRGTRAIQMGTGLAVIFSVYLAARQIGLVTLYNMLSTLLSSFILIVVVVFQNDIRRGLMRVGSRAVLGGNSRQQESRVIDEVVAAVTELARHRIGALICFEQDANLDEFVVSQGTTIDAQVQRELLVGIFVPESLNKLHDGALVIRNFRIAKAGVFFPMPETKNLDKALGSRHRAALGITEETDAVVVVVSEERGTISFCFGGNLVSNLDGASLRQGLLGLFGQRTRAKKRGAPSTQRRPPIGTPAASSSPLSSLGHAMGGASATSTPTSAPARVTLPSGGAGSTSVPPPATRRSPDAAPSSEGDERGVERVLTASSDGPHTSDRPLKSASEPVPMVGIAAPPPTKNLDTPLPRSASVPPPPRGPSEK